MKNKLLLSIASGLLFISAQTNAAVNFFDAGDAIATAEWDTWSYGPTYPGFGAPLTVSTESGSQGSGSYTSNGASFTSSGVNTTILDGYSAPPGGLLNGGDSYYIHNGAYTWSVSGELDTSATHFRVSYGLVSYGGETTDFTITPNTSIDGASVVTSGSYSYSGGDVYYTTFTVAGGSSEFSAGFGDVVTWPSFVTDAGSYKSVDAIYLEAFNGSPNAVPEPQAFALISGILAILSLAARRRVRS